MQTGVQIQRVLTERDNVVGKLEANEFSEDTNYPSVMVCLAEQFGGISSLQYDYSNLHFKVYMRKVQITIREWDTRSTHFILNLHRLLFL